MKTKTHIKRIGILHQRSILWQAMLHSVLLSTLSIGVISGISYLFIVSLIKKNVVGADVYEMLQNAAYLGQTIVLFAVTFLALSIVLSFSFAKKLVNPFMDMQKKLERLGPGHWGYRRTVHTGDEIEQLDTVVANLTKRLRSVYEGLEDEIEARTSELEEEYEKDRTILKALNIGLLVVDKDGNVIQANPTAGRLLNIASEKLLGRHITKVIDIFKHEKPLPKEKHPILRCLKTKKEVHVNPEVHLSIKRTDGTYLAVKISSTPLVKNRKLLGAVILFQDVTIERQIDYMKTDFINLASHHLRTPLSSLHWYLELLSSEHQKNLTKDQKSFIIEMRLAAKKMSGVVEELMDASRLNESGVSPVIERVNMTDSVKDLIKDTTTLFTKKNISIETSMPSKPVYVHTDPLLASIIIQNLISNAVKYSKEEGGKIQVSITKTQKTINVSVKDQGIGIPFAEQGRIFEKLYRAENARHIETDGAGLGLYSCKMIAEKLGANISFKSIENKGTVFTVTFPLKK